MADNNKKKYIKYEDTTYELVDSRIPDPGADDNGKVLGVVNGEYALKDEEGGSGPEVILVTIDDSTDPATASMTASEIRSAANGNIVRMNYYAAHDYVGIVEGKAVFSAVVGPDVSCVFVANNGAVEFWSKTIPTVPQMADQLDMSDWTAGKTVDAAVLATFSTAVGQALEAKYSKPSTGIPASDLASAVQTSLGKADTALQQHQSLADYQTKAITDTGGYFTTDTVEGALQEIGAELGDKADKVAVTASDNGKFLRVVNGAWAAASVPFQTPRVAMTVSDTTPTLDPNKMYVFPEMATLTPTLATPTDNTIVNEYHFMFTSGSTATTLTIPATIKQPDGFTVEANHVYEISIVDNYMLAVSWSVSA